MASACGAAPAAIPIPPSWTEALPPTHLDGEIWAGRSGFDKTVAGVARNRWATDVCFLIFDAPQIAGTWDKRIAAVQKRVRCSFASAVPWETVKDVGRLARMFRKVGEGGGEGLMLRCPGANYSAGRTDRVLKLTREARNRASLYVASLASRLRTRSMR